MHRVVQRLIRDELTPKVRNERVATAVRLLARAFPEDPNDPRSWEECGALQSHCVTALDEVEEHGLVSPESIRLGRRVGEYQLVRGAFDAALKRLNRTLAQLRGHGGDPAELTATELALSRVYYQQADLRRAREHAQEALRLNESAVGPEDRTTAAILLELSKIQLELTEFEAAKSSVTRSLAIHRALEGEPADLIGKSLETLGIVLWRTGAWEQAEENLRQSVALLAGALGPESGVTARARTCWGLVLRDAARHDADALRRAEAQFQLAYSALKNAHGHDHPDTCSAAIHLADTRHRRVRAELLRREPHLLNGAYGQIAQDFQQIMLRLPMKAQKPSRACGLVRQGHLLNNSGDHEQARTLVHEARGIYIQSYGPEHPYVAEALTRLITIEYDLDNVEKSTQYAHEARQIYAEKYGAEHPYVRQIDEFLASPQTAGRD
jgi:tetratricopeptide (TPR) repeat protein